MPVREDVMRIYSNRDRPSHLGPYALERLARLDSVEPRSLPLCVDACAAHPDAIGAEIETYAALFRRFLGGAVAPRSPAVPDDPVRRAENLKASAYFLDAALAGTCVVAEADRLDLGSGAGGDPDHTHALVFAVPFGRVPAADEPGGTWIRGTNVARTDMRATEIAVILAGYLRWMGFPARGHVAGDTLVDLSRLAIRAGIARAEGGRLVAPFLSRGFRIGVVTTGFVVAPDRPLVPDGDLGEHAPEVYVGIDGTRPGWADAEEEQRPLHMGRYPMETIRRVEEPTTLVIRQEIGRVPKRGDFFKRAEAGDLGDKPRLEKKRFPMKHPLALGMQPLIQAMVPLQGDREKQQPTGRGGDLSDPERNAAAIKALGYYLGADFVGICRAEPWMYYATDDTDGRPIAAYHDYAVVMLIDQGYETMDGASGDDWISASQSMRAYLRGAEIAGVMAAHCRKMGFSARSHSNAHSEIIHNPAILMAGLGEVSRIGDTLLNPFIGPRSKSVVLTTDLPMTVDKPIDFGLQDFCDRCRKCARECPCNAITFGPKVMFNGYEIWKADVEKCTKYRVTQMKGSACGRCMKMCPWNRDDTVAARELAALSIRHPEARPAIIAMDDVLQNGKRNLIKRWWFDLEVVDGIAGAPVAGTNERDLSPGRDDKLTAMQRLALFPPKLQPAPGTTLAEVVPVDRVAGMDEYRRAETPDAARRRLRGSAS
jgi:reductive dehalogenase